VLGDESGKLLGEPLGVVDGTTLGEVLGIELGTDEVLQQPIIMQS
jgi:hypothetical protein